MAAPPCVVLYGNSAYLAGIKNARQLGKETRTLPTDAQVEYTRCTFKMDGPALADYMGDKLE
jgi:alkylated DNA nucleotide flippase Atl1